MPPTRAEKTMRSAAAKAPGTITKQHRGQPSSRKSFKVWTVSQLLEQYRDPRAILLEIAGMDTKALAKEMQCSLIDALAERRLAAMCVLPYVAQKLPAQIDLRSSRTINLNIVDERTYTDLVAIAADEEQSDDAFSIALMPSNAEEVTSDRPVTPSTPAPSREGE